MKFRYALLSAVFSAALLLASCVSSPERQSPSGSSAVAPSETIPEASALSVPEKTPLPPDIRIQAATVPTSDDMQYYVVGSNELAGVIDGRGSVVLPVKFESVEILQYGNSPTVFFTIDGTTHIAGKSIVSNGGLYDTSGKRIAALEYEGAQALSENLIFVTSEGSSGIVSFGGKEIVPCEYDEVFLCGGYIVAASRIEDDSTDYDETEGGDSSDYDETEEDDSSDYEETEGGDSSDYDETEEDDSSDYDETEEDTGNEDYFPAVKQDVHIYNAKGKLLRNKTINLPLCDSEEYYPDNYSYHDDKYIYVTNDTGNGLGVIDTEFKEIIPAIWDEVCPAGTNTFIVSRGEEYGVVDLKGNIIIPVNFDSVTVNADEEDPGKITFSADDAEGAYLFDCSGKEIYHSNSFISAALENGFVVVTDKGDMMHVLDKGGEDLFPPYLNIRWNPESQLFECIDDNYDSEDYYYQYYDIIDACYTEEGVRISLPGLIINYPVSPERYIGEYEQSGRKMYVLYDGSGKALAMFDYLEGGYGDRLLHAFSGIGNGYVDLSGKWVWQTSEYNALMD